MTHEEISVRMNRSSSAISWGFTVSSDITGTLRITSIDKDGLASKAGLQADDIIDKLHGRDAKCFSANEASNLIQQSTHEILLNLKRYYSTHNCLPWTLTERDNMITIDPVSKTKRFPVHDTYSSHETKHQYYSEPKSVCSTPVVYAREKQNKVNIELSDAKRSNNISYRAQPFTNVTNSSKTENYQQPSQFQNLCTGGARTSNKSNWLASNDVPILFDKSGKWNECEQSLGRIKNDDKTINYAPVHVDTSMSDYNGSYSPFTSARSGNGKPQSPLIAYDNREKVGFMHSRRTIHQLSPTASIQHLQYNSPEYLYSHQAAEEQYQQQTGGVYGTDSSLHQQETQYLPSETRKLIAEQEEGMAQAHSPSYQSASFKRISRACGTPVE